MNDLIPELLSSFSLDYYRPSCLVRSTWESRLSRVLATW